VHLAHLATARDVQRLTRRTSCDTSTHVSSSSSYDTHVTRRTSCDTSILEHAGHQLNSNDSNVGKNTHVTTQTREVPRVDDLGACANVGNGADEGQEGGVQGEGSESGSGGGGCGGAGQGDGRTHISTTCLSPGPQHSQDHKGMGVSSPVGALTTSPVYFYVNVGRSPDSSHQSENTRPLTAGMGCRKLYRGSSAMGEGGSGGGEGSGESHEFGFAALSVRQALPG
jgi:hypothetical protein